MRSLQLRFPQYSTQSNQLSLATRSAFLLL